MDERFQVVTCYLGIGNNWDSLHWDEPWRRELYDMCRVIRVNSIWSKTSSYNRWLEFSNTIKKFLMWLSCPIQIWLGGVWLHFQVGIDWKVPLKDFDCLGWDHLPNLWPLNQGWSNLISTSTRGTGWRGRRTTFPREEMHSFQLKGEARGRKNQTTLVKSC